ncbi:MAG: carboxypeptidase-like regulatory domain-containing protein [Gemmataceae bacterium]
MVAMMTTLRAGRYGRTRNWKLLALMLLAGCNNKQPPVVEAEASGMSEAGSLFDPTTAGSIHGQVVWEGCLPSVPLFHAPTSPRTEQPGSGLLNWPNPNVPRIDSKTRAVEEAVVYLKAVDPKKAKPWDLDPVTVQMQNYQFHILQGKAAKLTGFIRLGDPVEMISGQGVFHSVHTNGSAFFSIPFPDRDRAVKRRLDREGMIELTSAAGYFWMRGYLFVCRHPYITRTDAQGNFDLAGVPPGDYEVVCWLPNWQEDHHDRDPETSYWTRLFFKEPLIVRRDVSLRNIQSKEVVFPISEKLFP